MRSELYKDAADIYDPDKELKKQAGVDELSEYANFFEIQIACELLNCSENELLSKSDAYLTKHLLSKRKNANFDKTFHELKYPKK